jgi:hypothetical protein
MLSAKMSALNLEIGTRANNSLESNSIELPPVESEQMELDKEVGEEQKAIDLSSAIRNRLISSLKVGERDFRIRGRCVSKSSFTYFKDGDNREKFVFVLF